MVSLNTKFSPTIVHESTETQSKYEVPPDREVKDAEKYLLSTIKDVTTRVLVVLKSLKEKQLALGNLTLESLTPDKNNQIPHDFSQTASENSFPKEFTQPVPYMSPEVVMKARPYTSEMDMWSLGCILYRMFTGEFLFTATDRTSLRRSHFVVLGDYPLDFQKKTVILESSEKRDNLRKKLLHIANSDSTSVFFSNASDISYFADFLMQMLNYRPRDRLTPGLALSHPFICGDYVCNSRIGSGAYSNVYSAMQRTSSISVALKIAYENDYYLNKLSLVKEAKIIRHLNAESEGKEAHIIRLVSNFWHKDTPHIALEMCKGQNLSKLLITESFSLEKIQHLGRQLLVALSFLKEQRVLHADFRSNNIVFRDDTCKDLVVLDLGLSSYIGDPLPSHTLTQRYYRAPEVYIKARPYTSAIDMWGLGCILYEMFTSSTLFSGDLPWIHFRVLGKYPINFVAKAKYLSKIDKLSKCPVTQSTNLKKLISENKNALNQNQKHLDSFIDLLEKILVYEPEKRLTPDQAVEHPFFRIDFSTKDQVEQKLSD